jgi:hypothetical protein
MLKRDSIWFGLLLGTLLPVVLYLIITAIGKFTEPGTIINRPFEGYKPILLSLVVNLVTLRIYFVNLKMDKTGRGILLATFTIGVIFFIFFKHL